MVDSTQMEKFEFDKSNQTYLGKNNNNKDKSNQTYLGKGKGSIKKGGKCGLLPYPGEGGSAREVKKPHCFFGVLKMVKNGLKMAKKNTLKI